MEPTTPERDRATIAVPSERPAQLPDQPPRHASDADAAGAAGDDAAWSTPTLSERAAQEQEESAPRRARHAAPDSGPGDAAPGDSGPGDSRPSDAEATRLPEPPPPADATVARSSLPRVPFAPPQRPASTEPERLPEPPPPDDSTVARSSLPRVPFAPPQPRVPAQDQRLPEPPPPDDATVTRSSLPRVPLAEPRPPVRPFEPPPRPSGPPRGQGSVEPGQPRRASGPPADSNATVSRSSLGVPPLRAGGYAPAPAAPSSAARPMSDPGQPHVTLDPAALRSRISLRAGAAALTIDEQGVRLRSWFSRRTLGWGDIVSFEIRADGVGASGSGGHLVANTRSGPVDLPATKRSMSDLRYLHALLDAYRRRAGY